MEEPVYVFRVAVSGELHGVATMPGDLVGVLVGGPVVVLRRDPHHGPWSSSVLTVPTTAPSWVPRWRGSSSTSLPARSLSSFPPCATCIVLAEDLLDDLVDLCARPTFVRSEQANRLIH